MKITCLGQALALAIMALLSLGGVWPSRTAAAANMSGASDATGTVPVVRHHALVTLDVALHGIEVTDTLLVPAGLDSFTLNKSLFMTEIRTPTDSSDAAYGKLSPVTFDGAAQAARPGQTMAYDVDWLPRDASGDRRAIYRYHGTFLQSTQDVTFSRENVGGEIGATISDEGIYLSSGACWLPTFAGALATHTLTIATPAGMQPITQGRLTLQTEMNRRLLTTWVAEHPADGINLVANRYVITEEASGPTSIFTYLLSDDQELSALYLERTKAYLTMYEEMIGPYPYAKFATVENWFPTGYGMPSYTLLGGAVLRLPFIPYTSFGHEICHNWWGNSVFVGEGGNWCEGLTVYCADYHYKELESPAAARDYRRNLLKDYAAYVNEGKDFPLAEFTSRHSGATRAVGYGKSMMLLHMIDRSLGRDTFVAALRRFYRDHIFQLATWSDLFSAFDETSGRDLSTWQEQWLTRTGAPTLQLEKATLSGSQVQIKLSQGAPSYDLEIPIVMTTSGDPVEQVVHLSKTSDTFILEAPGATAVTIDPDYHVFRRLLPQEIEPTISQVLGEEVPTFVLPAGSDEEVEAARQFAVAFSENEHPTLLYNGRPPVDVAPGQALSNILINPPAEVLKSWLPPEVSVAGNLLFIEGKRYSLADFDAVLTARNPSDPTSTDLIVLCHAAERLPSLARRIGHYGKYSWLVLPAGAGETLKGNWQPAAQPLAAQLVP